MNTAINIPQELIDTLVRKEIEKQVKDFLDAGGAYGSESFIKAVALAQIKRSMNLSVIDQYVTTCMENQMSDPHSFLNTNITTKIETFISNWITNNKYNIETTIRTAITNSVRSVETYTKYIEPFITKCIAEDSSFIPYAKQEIAVKLNEKIKNFNKLVGDNISSDLVKAFLQNYLVKRDLDSE